MKTKLISKFVLIRDVFDYPNLSCWFFLLSLQGLLLDIQTAISVEEKMKVVDRIVSQCFPVIQSYLLTKATCCTKTVSDCSREVADTCRNHVLLKHILTNKFLLWNELLWGLLISFYYKTNT